jgi:hypothetical protein
MQSPLGRSLVAIGLAASVAAIGGGTVSAQEGTEETAARGSGTIAVVTQPAGEEVSLQFKFALPPDIGVYYSRSVSPDSPCRGVRQRTLSSTYPAWQPCGRSLTSLARTPVLLPALATSTREPRRSASTPERTSPARSRSPRAGRPWWWNWILRGRMRGSRSTSPFRLISGVRRPLDPDDRCANVCGHGHRGARVVGSHRHHLRRPRQPESQLR